MAIAASAGGLRALEQVLGALSPDLNAAILVVQHLNATHPSHLPQILARATRLVVREAQAGDMLECGTAFIAPPGFHLIVDATGMLTLSLLPPVHFVRPSADHLFRSIAENFRARAIAVVLTGMGSDGASATLAVHSLGGVVIAQDESTSQFFGMPGAAIAAGHVDQVLRLDQIAGALTALVGLRAMP